MLHFPPIIDKIIIIGGVFMNELLVGMGQRIASARKAKNLTQEQLADLSGVSYQTISSAELDKNRF
jgi:DNA-binding XRE family transcriptional regulator